MALARCLRVHSACGIESEVGGNEEVLSTPSVAEQGQSALSGSMAGQDVVVHCSVVDIDRLDIASP